MSRQRIKCRGNTIEVPVPGSNAGASFRLTSGTNLAGRITRYNVTALQRRLMYERNELTPRLVRLSRLEHGYLPGTLHVVVSSTPENLQATANRQLTPQH